MRIKQNLDNLKLFKSKVVFAPNGFGKTQFSEYIKRTYEGKYKKVAFFSSKEINSLISFKNSSLKVESDSYLRKDIDSFNEWVDSKKLFEKYFISETQFYLKENYLNSFVFRFLEN